MHFSHYITQQLQSLNNNACWIELPSTSDGGQSHFTPKMQILYNNAYWIELPHL